MTKTPTETASKPKKPRKFWLQRRVPKGQTDQRSLKAVRRGGWPV